MKAFLAALVAIVLIAVGAQIYLESLGLSSAQVYSRSDVRLGE